MSTLSHSPDWANRAPPCFPPPWASAWGSDRYGLWAEFCLSLGDIVQRMRWVEAGSFMMGSPVDEAGRFDDEGPVHYVTISQGFWLADTACTQALWQAVMGENPSHFHAKNKDGPDYPVEKVSWNMVQSFLAKLMALAPLLKDGCYATLPTEAEWEYACRADGQTAYHFGDEINSTLANYGWTADGTVPVKALSVNDWGLYQMHGNVREWCADGFRQYEAKDEQDPGLKDALTNTVADEGWSRVLRGGDWAYLARYARSACRFHFLPDGQGDGTGFRLAVRFQSSQ